MRIRCTWAICTSALLVLPSPIRTCRHKNIRPFVQIERLSVRTQSTSNPHSITYGNTNTLIYKKKIFNVKMGKPPSLNLHPLPIHLSTHKNIPRQEKCQADFGKRPSLFAHYSTKKPLQCFLKCAILGESDSWILLE